MSSAARRIFDDLLTLEINLIDRDEIPRGPAPEPAAALREVVARYDEFLCHVALRLGAEWAGEPAVSVRGPDRPGTTRPPVWRTRPDGTLRLPLQTTPVTKVVAAGTFEQLRERAVEAECVFRHVATTDGALDRATAIIVRRIYRNCDQIRAILERDQVAAAVRAGAAELPLTADEVLTVRKVWEVGVESVVMQTVVQLDGDVVTRIAETRLDAPDETLHAVHQEGVDRAMEQWTVLFEIIAQLAATMVRSVGAALRHADHRPAISDRPAPNGGSSRTWNPLPLISRCRALRSELFDGGGKVIETAATGGSDIIARTLIQPDGDVVCSVAPRRFATDEAARRAHAIAVSTWCDELAATLRTATTGVARAALVAGAGLGAVASLGLDYVAGAVLGVGSMFVTPLSRWLGLAVAALGRDRTEEDTAAITAWTRRGLAAGLTVVAIIAAAITGHMGALAAVVVIALVIGVLVQFVLRKVLRLAFKRSDRVSGPARAVDEVPVGAGAR